jgi:hypothetical protein
MPLGLRYSLPSRSNGLAISPLERPPETEELKGLLGEVNGWFRRHPDQERLRYLFAELICQAYKELGQKPPASYDWLEMKKMKSNFPTTVKTWVQQAAAEGRAEGVVQGRSEGEVRGRIESKAEDLVHLLVARFGALTPSLRTRIQRARLATLERWFKRAVAASDLRSVFNSPR